MGSGVVGDRGWGGGGRGCASAKVAEEEQRATKKAAVRGEGG